jgi:hypothetical protein
MDLRILRLLRMVNGRQVIALHNITIFNNAVSEVSVYLQLTLAQVISPTRMVFRMQLFQSFTRHMRIDLRR